MQEQDLQQISNVLDKKFEENNKKLRKDIVDEIGEKIDEVSEKVDDALLTSKNQFDENTERFNKIDQELAKKPTKGEFSNWRDKQVEPVERDVDKLKYIHRDKWKDLPDSGEVSRVLKEEGLKA